MRADAGGGKVGDGGVKEVGVEVVKDDVEVVVVECCCGCRCICSKNPPCMACMGIMYEHASMHRSTRLQKT